LLNSRVDPLVAHLVWIMLSRCRWCQL